MKPREEVVASMEEEAGSDQLAPEKCGKEKVPFGRRLRFQKRCRKNTYST